MSYSAISINYLQSSNLAVELNVVNGSKSYRYIVTSVFILVIKLLLEDSKNYLVTIRCLFGVYSVSIPVSMFPLCFLGRVSATSFGSIHE